MPNFQPVSHKLHAHQHWLRMSSYAFAATDMVIPLNCSELPKAIMSLPVGFIAQGETFIPVALMGLQPGKNLLVASDGRWLGAHIPFAFRSYPFALGKTAAAEQVLCFDQDSGLLTDKSTGERFFAEDGQPIPLMRELLNFLTQNEQNHLATVAACAVLQKHSLIRDWPITVKSETGEQTITGLFQVDEARLNQLSGEALLEVREAGALLLAYCQLLSMQQLPLLGQLSRVHAVSAAQAAEAEKLLQPREINLDFLSRGGTFSFS